MEIELSQATEQLEDMVNGFVKALPGIIVALVVLLIFYALGLAIRLFVRRASDRYGRRPNLGIVLGRLAQWAVILLGLGLAMMIVFPSFTPAQLVQLLGIGSVAIGFAFRDILQNFLSGIILLIGEPFRIGDQIVVNGFEGTIQDIQTRDTTIRTYDGRQIVVPNAYFLTNIVTVNTAFEMRRIEYDVGIGYDDDVEKAKHVILETLRGMDGILSDPSPEVLLVSLGDHSVNLRARWWIRPPRRAEMVDTRNRVLGAIKAGLKANGIVIPYPIRQVIVQGETSAVDR